VNGISYIDDYLFIYSNISIGMLINPVSRLSFCIPKILHQKGLHTQGNELLGIHQGKPDFRSSSDVLLSKFISKIEKELLVLKPKAPFLM